MISGSCLCGAVMYKVTGKVSDIIYCHCATCRKASGSAFASVASVAGDDFQLTGEAQLGCFESSPGKKRFFCRTCGTHIYGKRDGKQNIALRLGSLDTDIPSKEFAHIWLSDSANWHHLDSDLPRYEEDWR